MGTVPVNVALTINQFNWVEKEAERRGLSRSSLIKIALSEYIDRQMEVKKS